VHTLTALTGGLNQAIFAVTLKGLPMLAACSINGDNTFLNDKLEQLRTIDSLAKLRF
jgi:hypothetical protein